MPFAFLLIGIVLIIAAARGTLGELGRLMKGDFSGENNFFFWLIAFGVVGTLGYIQVAQKFSRAFMALVLIAMVLKNGGVFDNLVTALTQASAGSSGSGAAGNTLDNTQAAPQSTQGGSGASAGSPGANIAAGMNGVLGQPPAFAAPLLNGDVFGAVRSLF